MNRIDKYKYHVVKFLDNHLKDTERVSWEHVCVPRSWLTWRSPESNVVRVWYPPQDTCNTEEKVRKREIKSDQWESFLAILMYSTDMYEKAKNYILDKENSENKEGRKLLSAMVEKKKSKTTSSVIRNEATTWSIISSKSVNTVKLKRTAPAESDKTAHRKRSRVNEPSKSVDEVAGPSSQTFNNQTLTQNESNDGNSTKKKQIVNQNTSKSNYSLDHILVVLLQTSPVFAKCCQLILELQTHLGTSLVKEIIMNLINTDNSRSALINDIVASASSNTKVQAPKLNEEKRNEEQTEENDCNDDDCDDDE